MLRRKSQSWIKHVMPLLAVFGLTVLLSGPVAADDMFSSAAISLVTSDVLNNRASCHSVIIQWETNGDATSQVFYDIYPHENDDEYACSTVEDAHLATEHRVRITGLNELTKYYYRVKSVIPGTDYAAISEEYSFITPHCPTPQGDCSTYRDYYLRVGHFGEDSLYRISESGVLLETIEFSSQDGKLVLTIPKGTVALDNEGRRLEFIEIEMFEEEPLLPIDCCLVGGVYSLQPDGAQFDPPIQLLMAYDSNDLADNVMEQNLFAACSSGMNIEWMYLSSQFSMEDRIFEVNIGHFTMFTVLGFITPSFSSISEVPHAPAPTPGVISSTPSVPSEIQPQVAQKPVSSWPIPGLILCVGTFIIIFFLFRRRQRSSHRIIHSVPPLYSNR